MLFPQRNWILNKLLKLFIRHSAYPVLQKLHLSYGYNTVFPFTFRSRLKYIRPSSFGFFVLPFRDFRTSALNTINITYMATSCLPLTRFRFTTNRIYSVHIVRYTTEFLNWNFGDLKMNFSVLNNTVLLINKLLLEISEFDILYYRD